MEQLLEPSKKNDKSLNQDDDLSMNCVRDSILHSSNLSPNPGVGLPYETDGDARRLA